MAPRNFTALLWCISSALVAAGVTMVVVGVCLGDPRSDLLAAWLEAIGTVGAFAVALALAYVAIVDRQKAQARLVSGTFGGLRLLNAGAPVEIYKEPIEVRDLELLGGTLPPPSGQYKVGRIKGGAMEALDHVEGPGGESTTPQLKVDAMSLRWTLENRSEETIFELRALLLDEGAGEAVFDLATHPVLAPGFKQTMSVVAARDRRVPGRPVLQLTFKDAVGRRWVRRTGQPLQRYPLNAPPAALEWSSVPPPILET